jgi:hypothetical protein
MDVGLFYSNNKNHELVGYDNVGYLYDSRKVRSQIDYLFTRGTNSITWRFTNQTLVVTSSIHAEIFKIYDAS